MKGGRRLTRAVRAPEFWLLLMVTITALAGVGWRVTLPLAMCGLSVASLPKYLELWPRARRAGAMREWWMTVGLSVFNSLGTAVAAHVLGVVVGWMWAVR